MDLFIIADLLLLHELGVGAVVDNILSEDGGRQNSVDVLGAYVFMLAVQNEVITCGAKVYCRLLSKEDESEDIAKLFISLLVHQLESCT